MLVYLSAVEGTERSWRRICGQSHPCFGREPEQDLTSAGSIGDAQDNEALPSDLDDRVLLVLGAGGG